MADFPKKQQQCLIPKYLLDYTRELNQNHPDPSDPWGGGGGSPIEAGTGIVITGDDTKTISVDTDDVAMVSSLSAVAFSGDYDDLTDKPTIPTNVSDLNNDAGYITGITSSDVTTALGYTPSNDNDVVKLTGTQTIEGSKTFGSTVIQKSAYGTGQAGFIAKNTDVYYAQYHDAGFRLYTTNLYGNQFHVFVSADRDNSSALSTTLYLPNKGGAQTIATTSDIPTATSDLTNDSGFITGITSSDVTTALGYTPGTSNFSGSYTDLTDKPTIPDAVSGVNDGTNWTSLTIGSDTYAIPQGSTPTNMVTTNTTQDITGEKTFVGSTRIKFEKSASSDTLGFTCYDESSKEFANMQAKTRTVGGVSEQYLTLGNYAASADGYGHAYVGFRINPTNTSSNYYNFLAPHGTSTQFNNSGYSSSNNNYLVASITNGNTNVVADATGKVDISSLMPTVPSSASTTINPTTTTAVTGTTTTSATVVNSVTYTPATETLVFTYSDNTTATITLLTSSTTVSSTTTGVVASVSESTATVMTGATATTTLS